MVRWRKLLGGLGRFPNGVRTRHYEECEADDRRPSAGVEPSEVALILLKNAMRLLDQSMAPSKLRHHLAAAISELEEWVARRSR